MLQIFPTVNQTSNNWYHRIILVALLLALFVLRIPLFSIPLERDEGEYAYMGQQMLQGIPPYAQAYTMKLPGTAAMYAVIMLFFGQTNIAIHFALSIIIIINAAFIYLLAKRMMDLLAAIIAAATFALMAGSSAVLGTALHATHFILLFALPAILLLLKADQNKKSNLSSKRSNAYIFFSGILFGLAILMKQPAIFLLPLGFVLLFLQRPASQRARWLFIRSVIFITGVLLPILATAGFLYRAGVWQSFWFWTIEFPQKYITATSIQDGLRTLVRSIPDIFGSTSTIWLGGTIGLILALKRQPSQRIFLIAIIVCLGVTVLPGLFFRPHYFVMVTPCLAFGLGFAWHFLVGKKMQKNFFFAACILAAMITPTIMDYNVFLTHDNKINSLALYSTWKFDDAVDISEYLSKHTQPDEKILIIGNEPEIYFLTKRKSATKFIYTYEINRPTAKQAELTAEFIQQAEQSKPKYVVLSTPVEDGFIGERPKESHNAFRQWSDNFLKDYKLVTIKSDLERGPISPAGIEFLLANRRFPSITLFEQTN